MTIPHSNHVHIVAARRSGCQQLASPIALNLGYTRRETTDYTVHLFMGSFLVLLVGWEIVFQVRWRKNLSS